MHCDDLPKGPARLVFREGGVTHIIQGPKEDVEQRLWQEVAVEFLDSAEEHPCPIRSMMSRSMLPTPVRRE